MVTIDPAPSIGVTGPSLAEKRAAKVLELDRCLHRLESLNDIDLLKVLQLCREVLYTDPLTGLKNLIGAEYAFYELLESQTQNEEVARININVAGFSKINSGLGYSYGDMFLSIFATKLSEIFGIAGTTNESSQNSEDTNIVLVRLGGGNFIILLKLSTNKEAYLSSKGKDIEGAYQEALAQAIEQFEQAEHAEDGTTRPSKINDEVSVTTSIHAVDSETVTEEIEQNRFEFVDILNTGEGVKDKRLRMEKIGVEAVRAAQGILSLFLAPTEKRLGLINGVSKRRNRIISLEDSIKRYLKSSADSVNKDLVINERGRKEIFDLISLYLEAIDIDSKTGLYNRHWLGKKLVELATLANRSDQSKYNTSNSTINCSVMGDLISFGDINILNLDKEGDGDTVLVVFSDILYRKCNQLAKDLKCEIYVIRTGGDEFHLLFIGLDLSQFELSSQPNINVDINDISINQKAVFIQKVIDEIFSETIEELREFCNKAGILYHSAGVHTAGVVDLADLYLGLDGKETTSDVLLERLTKIEGGDVDKRSMSLPEKIVNIAKALGGIAVRGISGAAMNVFWKI